MGSSLLQLASRAEIRRRTLGSSLRNFKVDTGDLIKQYLISLSRMSSDILKTDNDTLLPLDFTPNHDLVTERDLLPNCEKFP